MAKEHASSPHQEFTEFVQSVQNASATFTESVSQINKVYLAFCDHLLRTAMETQRGILELEKEFSTTAKTLNKEAGMAAAKAKKDTVAAGDQAKAAMAPSKNNSGGDGFVPPYNQLAAQLLYNTKLIMENFIHAQSDLYITAQAATTMGIMQIYSASPIRDGKPQITRAAAKTNRAKK